MRARLALRGQGAVTVLEEVRGATGLDLSNGAISVDVLAPEFAKRLAVVLRDFNVAKDVATKVYTAYTGLVGSATVLGALSAAVAAVQGVLTGIYAQAGQKAQENVIRRASTRRSFVERYYRRGAWAQVLGSRKAPSPKDLDLTRNTQSPGKHLGQYDPFYVWHVSRVARTQVLYNTWHTPPYDSPGSTPDRWQAGLTFPDQILGGFSDECPWGQVPQANCPVQRFQGRPDPVSAIPSKYADKYWGSAPNGGSIDGPSDIGQWGLDWAPLDASVFVSGAAPPPGYQYLFSWGTFPHVGWTSMDGLTPQFDFCPEIAALAAAIHALTPIHAAIPAADVARAYRHFLAASGWRTLPILPAAQVDGGAWIDPSNRLPFSPVAGWPLAIGPYQVSVNTVREIELAFRNFFRIRVAALYQAANWSPAFREAAAASLDPTLRDVAAGKPPPAWTGWAEWDPLGDRWWPEAEQGQKAKPRPGLGGPSKLAGKGGDVSPLAVAAGGALLWKLFL